MTSTIGFGIAIGYGTVGSGSSGAYTYLGMVEAITPPKSKISKVANDTFDSPTNTAGIPVETFINGWESPGQAQIKISYDVGGTQLASIEALKGVAKEFKLLKPDGKGRIFPGSIMEVGEEAEEGFPGGRAFRIVIFLSPFNVHVNRVPRSGKVVNLRYFRGRFQAAMNGDCDKVNEQFWLDLEEPSGRLVRIKQVSGAVARRIVCWARPNEELKTGERYGMIKLGSRTDVLIPTGEAIDVLVKKGDAVRGGSTILLRFRSSPAI